MANSNGKEATAETPKPIVSRSIAHIVKPQFVRNGKSVL